MCDLYSFIVRGTIPTGLITTSYTSVFYNGSRILLELNMVCGISVTVALRYLSLLYLNSFHWPNYLRVCYVCEVNV
jgi:hypothetical protein